MAKTVKDVLEATETKEGTKGFVTALLVVVIILTTVDFLGAIEFRTPPQSDWFSTNTFAQFPSGNPEYRLFVGSIGEHAGSLEMTAEKIDGWTFDGTFYLGDTVLIGNWRVTLKEINMDRDKPILLEFHALIDLKLPLVIALILLAVTAFYYWKQWFDKKR